MKIKIGDYLIKRLKEYGIDNVYGVPGDYNLGFLDLIYDAKGIEWIGNCNELNAGYAADGYARMKGFASLVTTFGVGELSAINAIAGSYAENVPVVKIVGSPSTMVEDNRALVHHSLGEGEFDTFSRIFKEVTVAQTKLNEMNAAKEIDRVLNEVFIQKRPGYIELPVDMVSKEIDVEMEKVEFDIKSNQETLDKFIFDAKEMVKLSKNQFILADYKVLRAKVESELENFINAAKIPVSTLSMGKGSINEQNEYFAGVYTGSLSPDKVKEVVNISDLAILVGVKLTDSTTAGFSFMNPSISKIEIDLDKARIGRKIYTGISMKDVLVALTNAGIDFKSEINVDNKKIDICKTTDEKLIQNRYFKIMESFIQEGDVVVAEQGTSFFGASTMKLPKNVSFVGQPLWGSIGYTVGAILGTQMADMKRRNILLVGDGSFQLTAQEVSTMLRHKLNSILFVVNNDGYTVERVIHGPRREYNDIQMWDYNKLPQVFAPNSKEYLTFSVSTENELKDAMIQARENINKLIFIEVHMGMDDVPDMLAGIAQRFVNQNGY
ncbi:MAG: alpha-keto acid decarboxylase family protein [Sarcina sp.]